MSKRSGVLAAGNWIVDHVKRINIWPSQDALANILGEYRGTGGAPFNVLIDLARLGTRFPLYGAGVTGPDEGGQWIRGVCEQQGVDTSQLAELAGAVTSYTDVMTVAETGRRTFFHQRGANALLDSGMIDLQSVEAKMFHLGYLLLLDRLDEPCPEFGTQAGRLLAQASALGFTTSVDLVSEESDRFSRVVLPILSNVDLLFLNEFEAGRACSMKIRVNDRIEPRHLASAAGRLLKAGVRQWVIIHFPEGVYAEAADGRQIYQPSVQLDRDRIAGAAGAGDALAAGVLLGMHDGLPMERCLIFGVCAAAASLRHPSCTDAVASLADCLVLGDQFGYAESIFAQF